MTDWREELIGKMADAMFATDEDGTLRVDVMARAALAVAEPVIREQCAEIARNKVLTSEDCCDATGTKIANAIREEGMSDDVIRRYNGARPIQAPAQLLADAIHEIEVLRKENARLRAALKPFAVDEKVIHRWYSSDVFPYVPDDHPVLSNKITVGDLRAAAAALKEKGDE